MTIGEFMAAMARAEARAKTTGLTESDLTMIRDAGRAWHHNGQPADGALAAAWTEGQRVFAIGEARALERFREQQLIDLEIAKLEREVAKLYDEIKRSEAAQRKAARHALTQARIDKGVRWALSQ